MWVGVPLAIIAWVALGQVRGAGFLGIDWRSSLSSSGMARAMDVAQYVVPLLCLSGAGLWSMRRRPGRPAPATRPSSRGWAPDGSQDLPDLLTRALERQGYQVTPAATRGASTSDGVAFVLRKDRQTYLVRRQDWPLARVQASAVQALHRAMQARDAAGGIALTTGRYTRQAHAYAASCNVRLVEGSALAVLLRPGRASP